MGEWTGGDVVKQETISGKASSSGNEVFQIAKAKAVGR